MTLIDSTGQPSQSHFGVGQNVLLTEVKHSMNLGGAQLASGTWTSGSHGNTWLSWEPAYPSPNGCKATWRPAWTSQPFYNVRRDKHGSYQYMLDQEEGGHFVHWIITLMMQLRWMMQLLSRNFHREQMVLNGSYKRRELTNKTRCWYITGSRIVHLIIHFYQYSTWLIYEHVFYKNYAPAHILPLSWDSGLMKE